MANELQRGGREITLDRKRILFFDHVATFLLYQRFGNGFIPALYTVNEKKDLELKDVDVLAFFLWAGLQKDAKACGEELTLERVTEFIIPFTLAAIFREVVIALTASITTPEQPGKAAAAPQPARVAASATPGPTRVTTSSKRSGSR